jgi:hypothetical protein
MVDKFWFKKMEEKFFLKIILKKADTTLWDKGLKLKGTGFRPPPE